jgi:ubiquinone/menaquinone biosynthesis C-methylase UbiE
MGRQIAHVMGHQAAWWLERPEREEEERTDLAVEALRLREGDAVADLGCGTGHYAARMARKVGPKGVVYGVDIQQEMLDLMMRQMRLRKIENVRPILGEAADPKLPESSLDLLVMVDVYHELEHPYEIIRAVVRALKPGGRLALIEFRGEDPTVPIKLVHKMTEEQIKRELLVHPELEWLETAGTLPRQHVAIFRRKL